jgi:hypothetical protein
MRTDETLAQLALENPVHEQDLLSPHSANAQALKERIMVEDHARPRSGGGRRHKRRRPALRAAIAAAAAAAIALGVTGALSGDGGLPGDGPETASAVERAVAVLSDSGDEILHTVERKTLESADGAETSYVETWQQLSPPYDHRRIEGRNGRGREFASVDGRPQVYNPFNNTIATLAPGVKAPDGGSLPDPPVGPPLGRLEQRRAPLQPWTSLRDQLLRLLRSGGSREAGRVTIADREAIRIVFRRWGITLAVDARTYEPIEWTMESEGPPTVETTRLTTFERLPATKANLAKLGLRAQHPDAKLDIGGITIDPDLPGKGQVPAEEK